MGSFAAGVTVVTTVDESGKPFGLTATAFSSVSLSPPLCLVCVDHRAEAHPVIVRCRRFAVSVLGSAQKSLSDHFAVSDPNKFDAVEWDAGPVTGCPLLPEALAAVECEVTQALQAGDHHVFVGILRSARTGHGDPLLYWGGRYGDFKAKA